MNKTNLDWKLARLELSSNESLKFGVFLLAAILIEHT